MTESKAIDDLENVAVRLRSVPPSALVDGPLRVQRRSDGDAFGQSSIAAEIEIFAELALLLCRLSMAAVNV